ncbi:NADH-quinone oxidoreductase subunit J [Marinilongibacter aquaticus]|uniref:NADH-quinone oxidoreductase subunit J family protein n=1 Tax=Marinilongibacter aquaticus TaxID=2975157 RepID=UPI0021BDA113|nr:NADH-quinone oxidoreductase subunit J [Marinilongibacter aquaticus]UBM58205.1 NADH-quinone oxidoreductase subunit J [Marinilongibacter aquaticus]
MGFSELVWLNYFVFGLFSAGALGGGLYLFFTKNILHGAYGLMVSLVSIAGLFLVCHAEFVAISQVMIYVGGILILIMFSIMLSAKGKYKRDALEVRNVNSLPSLLLALILGSGLVFFVSQLKWFGEGLEMQEEHNAIRDLGLSLMTNQVLILELVGILLLLVLIGASYIAKNHE